MLLHYSVYFLFSSITAHPRLLVLLFRPSAPPSISIANIPYINAPCSGLPSRNLVPGSPSIHQWLQRLPASPSVKKSEVSTSSSIINPNNNNISAGNLHTMKPTSEELRESFDSHPFNLASSSSPSVHNVPSSSSYVPSSSSAFVVGSPIKVSPRKLSIKSPVRSPLRLPLSPNVHQNRLLDNAAASGEHNRASPLSRTHQLQQQHHHQPLQQQQRIPVKRKRSMSDGDEDAVENASPTASRSRRSGVVTMKAKKRVFNDIVSIVENNNLVGEENKEGKLMAETGNSSSSGLINPSLGDLLPRDWCPKLTNGLLQNGEAPSGSRLLPSLPVQQPQQLHPLPPQQPLNVDERLLLEAPPMSAAAETTPTRPSATPKGRRIGVTGSGRRAVNSSTQKCIKFNQDSGASPSSGKNQTILKYFSKKS